MSEGMDTARITYRLGEPSASANLEPTQVAAHRGRAHDRVRILFDLFVWDCFTDGNLHILLGEHVQKSGGKYYLPGHLPH